MYECPLELWTISPGRRRDNIGEGDDKQTVTWLLTWVFIGKSSEEDRWVNALPSWAAGPGVSLCQAWGTGGKGRLPDQGRSCGHLLCVAVSVVSTFICSPGSVRSLEPGRGRIKARALEKGCHLLEDVRHGNRNL